MKKSILIFLFALLGVFSARAYDFEVDGIYYNIISGTDEVVVTYADNDDPITGYFGSVVIPATVEYDGNTYTVTSIGDNAFRDCWGLTSVTIPERVTSIGNYAFKGCIGLTSVTIPESVTYVEFGAFDDCSSLTSVEWNAVACQDIYHYNEGGVIAGVWIVPRFDNCENLTDITFGNRVTHIPACLCYGCSGLTSVTIPESVTSIGVEAFGNCSGLTSVTIPEGVTTIGEYAFNGCTGLTSVTIPESVTSIGVCAFYGCTSIPSPLYNSKIFAYLPQNYNGKYAIPSGIQTIAGCAFGGCGGLTSVSIPNSVTSIDFFTFSNCSGLTSVTMGEGVTSIGYGAFWHCSGLTSVTIPNSVTSIDGDAFYGCSGLTSIILSKNLDTIGAYAFYGCDKLLSITSLSKTPPYCYYEEEDDCVFSFYEGTLFVPRGCKMAYQTAPEWCKFSKIEELPGDPNDPDTPTANENSDADNFRVYVQDRTIHLSEDWGLVQVYNMAGQCVYNGHATAIPVQQGGLYIVKVGARSYKVIVR